MPRRLHFSAIVLACMLMSVVSLVCVSGDETDLQKEQARRFVKENTLAIEQKDESTTPLRYLYEGRGDAYMILGSFDKAYDDFTKAIAATPKEKLPLEAMQKQVTAAVKKGDYRRASEHAQALCRRAIHAHHFAMLALILARSPDEKVRNPMASLEAAKQASKLDSAIGADSLLVDVAMAAAYGANGDFDSAVAFQEKANGKVRGELTSEMKVLLNAYKNGKVYPFQADVRPE